MTRFFFATLAVTLVACTSSTISGPPGRVDSLDVMGTVADNAARPVANAQVAVYSVDPTTSAEVVQVGACTGGRLQVPAIILQTDASGRFKTTLNWIPDGPSACVTVQVTPAAGSSLLPAGQSKSGVRYKNPAEGRDIASFGFVLSPGP